MKITLIHGQNHRGSTYHIARMAAEKIGGDIDEYFLPRDFSAICTGCFACMNKGMEHCPHSAQAGPIFDSMLSADVIVIGSPTYVLEMTGQLKCFFDHLFAAWLSHSPQEAMFTKTGVVVSTAAGAGMGGVTKSLARQLFYLGVPKVYRVPERVAAMRWDEVKNKEKIAARLDKIASKIKRKDAKAKPGFKLKFMFMMMRQMQKGNNWAPLDKKHWEDMGWLDKSRPWK